MQVAFKTIVGDNLEHLTGAARIAMGRADVVIFSGGLGPTEDDLTREAVGAALGLELRRDNEILTELYKRAAARRMPMPENNAKQADVLDGRGGAARIRMAARRGSTSTRWWGGTGRL